LGSHESCSLPGYADANEFQILNKKLFLRRESEDSMRSTRVVISIAAAALFTLWIAPARADESNELTYFTFSGPVELPGMALPAGTYIFQHPDIGETHLVQVLSQDGRTVYGTFATIPETRPWATDEPSVIFDEQSAGAPPKIRAWFYPERTSGDEFLYARH
jgi:hypothetical protein